MKNAAIGILMALTIVSATTSLFLAHALTETSNRLRAAVAEIKYDQGLANYASIMCPQITASGPSQ